MALDPRAGLAIHPTPIVVPDQLEAQGKRLQMQNMMQEQQSGALDLQQKQLAVKSQAAMRQAYMESKGNMEKTLQRGAELGASQKDLMGFQSSQVELQQHLATLDKTQTENAKSHGEAMASEASGLLDIADPQKRAAAFPGTVQRLVSAGHVKPQEGQAMVSGAAADPNFLSDDNLKMMVAHGTLYKDQANIALEGRKTVAAEDTSRARVLSAKTEAEKFQAEKDLIAANTKKAQQEANGTVPVQPEQLITNKQQADNAAALAAHNKVIEGQGAGRLGVEQAKNAREQQAHDLTWGPNGNEALRGVEPKLRVQATGAAQKAADEHGKAQAAQADLQTFIDLAKTGNKTAHAFINAEGVLTLNSARGTVRVNRQEMEAYAGAGSLWDQVVGKVQKLATGQSIPPEILKSIEELHSRIAGNADDTYSAKLSSINQNYHANFQAAPKRAASGAAPVAYSKTATGPNGHKIGSNDGQSWFDVQTGQAVK